jgi:murein DD-endopeptidase MepM/ murein hydrolase activator NlpD
MLFNAMDKWWGNQGKREKPHEGLDLSLYRNREHRIFNLDQKTKIPALYDGVVVKVMDDFMGKSVMVEHRFSDSDYPRFCTIYGHTNLIHDLNVGRIVKAGDILVTLAQPNKSVMNVPSHLHISVGRIFNKISYEKLDWKTMSTLKTLEWVDPLQVISRSFP